MDILFDMLTNLFNKCFISWLIPDIWKKRIIQQIPKSNDIRDSMNYPGLSITSKANKMYCNILNKRLTLWNDANSIIINEQNGFRKGRSTIDHLSTLTYIVETQKLQKKQQPTFAAFIDFRKAYDCINRKRLFNKLNRLGLDINILGALKSFMRVCSVA